MSTLVKVEVTRWRAAPLFLLVACSASPPPAASNPVVQVQSAPGEDAPADSGANLRRERALDGVYRWPHEVTYVCDEPEWCTEEVNDTLTIRQEVDGLQIKIELVQTNYHVCNWEGRLSPSGRDKWHAAEEDCSIELSLDPNTIRITSAGCRDYCGARAYLEAEFPRDQAAEPIDTPRD